MLSHFVMGWSWETNPDVVELAPTVPVQAQRAEPDREVDRRVEYRRRAREGDRDAGDRSRCGRGLKSSPVNEYDS